MLDVVIDGVDELEAAIAQLPESLVRYVYGDACRAGALVIAAAAKTEVPVLTGALLRSIRVRRVRERWRGRSYAGAAAQIFVGGDGARHAHLVELGTRHSAANPFLRRAISKRVNEQHQRFALAAAQSFERVVRAVASPTARGSRAIIRRI